MDATQVFLAGLLVEGAIGLVAVGGMFWQTRQNTKSINKLEKKADSHSVGQINMGNRMARLEGFMEGVARAHNVAVPPPAPQVDPQGEMVIPWHR